MRVKASASCWLSAALAGLVRGRDLVSVDPRDLLADRHQLAHVRVEAGSLGRATEGLLVHVRRARGDEHAIEAETLLRTSFSISSWPRLEHMNG